MEELLRVTRARHNWPEEAGFVIDRPRGLQEYIFLHFKTEVEILVGGEIVTAPPGSVLIYNMDTPQWYRSPGPLLHDWMHMEGDIASLLFSQGLEPDRLYRLKNSAFITLLVQQIELELVTKQAAGAQMIDLKLRELLILLGRGLASHEKKPDSAAITRLQQVRTTVFSQLSKPWTVSDMAELAFLSPSRFHGVYRAAFGISPMDDLIQARIDNAKIRLSDTDESIQQIAEQLGYQNVTHFSRQFKAFTGMSPSAFRTGRRQ